MAKVESPAVLIEMLNKSGLAEKCPVLGCTDEEFSSLQSKFKRGLPRAYKEFLLLMGKSPGYFMDGCIYDIESLDAIKERAEAQAGKDGAELKDSFFVFMQRYNFVLYFDTESGQDDPPVFLLEAGRKESRQLFESMSKWLYAWVVLDLEGLQKYQDTGV